jgi:hypothetical protein
VQFPALYGCGESRDLVHETHGCAGRSSDTAEAFEVTALFNRQLEAEGRPRVNHKRIYRIMRTRQLLLPRYTGRRERRHDGKVMGSMSARCIAKRALLPVSYFVKELHCKWSRRPSG